MTDREVIWWSKPTHIFFLENQISLLRVPSSRIPVSLPISFGQIEFVKWFFGQNLDFSFWVKKMLVRDFGIFSKIWDFAQIWDFESSRFRATKNALLRRRSAHFSPPRQIGCNFFISQWNPFKFSAKLGIHIRLRFLVFLMMSDFFKFSFFRNLEKKNPGCEKKVQGLNQTG